MSRNNNTGSPIEFYTLEKPDSDKVDKLKIFDKFDIDSDEFRNYIRQANEPKYLYWDYLKYKGSPEGLSTKEGWVLIKQFRSLVSMKTQIRAEDGKYFQWIRLPCTDEFLHKIDTSSGGQIFTTMEALSEPNRQKFISRGILEEAIASSQLEGAHTTRQVAKKMIIEKREPRNISEQMILNNYNTMQALEEDYKDKDLSMEMLFEIHKMLTYKTIDSRGQGRLRKDEDDIVVRGFVGNSEYVTHIPPGNSFLKKEMKKFVEYANDKDEDAFLHPIIKAIFVHFWIGYLHPFVDGNGRMARALFYWYLLKKGYWTFIYLPISTIIKKAPSQYGMAYVYSEQDSHDLTYFYDFHIRKIIQALKDFNDYVTNKVVENKMIDRMLNMKTELNDRQKHLIYHLVSEENANTTVTSHSTLNNISRQTAAKDIKALEKDGLFSGTKEGTFIRYRATDKLRALAKERR